MLDLPKPSLNGEYAIICLAIVDWRAKTWKPPACSVARRHYCGADMISKVSMIPKRSSCYGSLTVQRQKFKGCDGG